MHAMADTYKKKSRDSYFIMNNFCQRISEGARGYFSVDSDIAVLYHSLGQLEYYNRNLAYTEIVLTYKASFYGNSIKLDVGIFVI